jgi:sulfur relay (sulfurtransferase) DsrC/TusE family protein
METCMADTEDDWVRKRAYALWEEEGKPHGKDAEHWEQARREYSAFALSPARRSTTKRKETSTATPDLASESESPKKGRSKKPPEKTPSEKKPATQRARKPDVIR